MRKTFTKIELALCGLLILAVCLHFGAVPGYAILFVFTMSLFALLYFPFGVLYFINPEDERSRDIIFVLSIGLILSIECIGILFKRGMSGHMLCNTLEGC